MNNKLGEQKIKMSKLKQHHNRQQSLTQKQGIISHLVRFQARMDIKVSYIKIYFLTFFKKTHSYLLILIFF